MQTTEADLSINECCEVLKLSRPSVYRLIRLGELKAYRVLSRQRVRRQDLDAIRKPRARK